jgi:hypothetical protein
MAKKDYRVSMTVTSTHVYHVPECNSPEEAITIAEEYFADGEDGLVEDTDVDSIDAVEDTGEED